MTHFVRTYVLLGTSVSKVAARKKDECIGATERARDNLHYKIAIRQRVQELLLARWMADGAVPSCCLHLFEPIDETALSTLKIATRVEYEVCLARVDGCAINWGVLRPVLLPAGELETIE